MSQGFDAADWRQANSVLAQLLELPTDERTAKLAALDLHPGLRDRISALLAAVDAPSPLDGDVLLDAAAAGLTVQPGAGLVGRHIGRYELLALIGQGGMSSVYRAVRDDGAYDTPVAFKLLSPALLGGDWSQRFARETALLARLRHPGIATLLDAGIADDGTPWLVTELIDGCSIDRYCEQRNLNLRVRVGLILDLCQAVAFVQRNLIVHRDIKCANVMVTDDGEVKLLDFGIARVLGDEVVEATATRVFTPDYAAPEQLRGEAATTATDVFGIGVLLYRLLTGVLPFDRDGERSHGQPTPPSRQVTGNPGLASDVRRQRAQVLRGDLDNIVGRALAERPEERYASAQALTDDLQAWLQHRPVQARRPSWPYRLRLFVRRRTELAVAVTLAVLAATSGLSIALWQAAEARRQADQALQAQARASAVATFLTELFEASDPDISGGRVADARELLATGTARVRTAFADAPELRAELLYTLAKIHRKIGDADSAAELRQDAASIVAADSPLALHLEFEEVAALIDQLAFDEALALTEQIEIGQGNRLDETTRIQLDLLRAKSLARLEGRSDETLALGRDLLRRVQENEVDMSLTLDVHVTQLGNLGIRQHLAEARQVGEAALALLDAGHATPTERISLYQNVSIVLSNLGDHEAAIELKRQALAIAREVYPAPHMQPAAAAGRLGSDLALTGRFAEALELLREAEAMYEQVYEQPNNHTVAVDNSLGWVLMALERPEQALPHFERGLAVLGDNLGSDHPYVRTTRSNRAMALSRLGRSNEAEAELLDVLANSRRQYGDDNQIVWMSRMTLAAHDLRHGRPERALREVDLAIAGWLADSPDGHPRLLLALGYRAQALALLGRRDEALDTYQEALAWAARPDAGHYHGYLDLLDHYSAFLAQHWPEQVAIQIPPLLDDPRLQQARERPHWRRIQDRLAAATSPAVTEPSG